MTAIPFPSNGHDQATTTVTSPLPEGPQGPRCDFDQGVYSVTFDDCAALMEFDYLSTDRDGGVWAELEVTLAHSTLLRSRVNLIKGNSRRDTAKDLIARTKLLGLDWDSMLETATYWVVERMRAGEPDIDLAEAPESPPYQSLLEPILIPNGTTILFGPGGSMKSYVALAMALSLQTGTELIKGLPPAKQMNVAFCDWEWNASVHRDRMIQLAGTDVPGLRYLKCILPLREERDRIRHMIRERNIEFLFIDSIAKSAGDEPETAKTANEYATILDSFEIPACLVGHITKSDRRKKVDTDTLFGSIFWENNARSTWSLQLSEGSPISRLGFFHKKHNLTRKSLPFTVEIEEAEDRLYMRKGQVRDDPALEAKLPIRVRISNYLRGGSRPLYEISEELDESKQAISNALSRGESIFIKMAGPDGVYRWGLRE